MTDTFRLVLCEPAVLVRVKKAIARKAKLAKGKWQGPLRGYDEKRWGKWYAEQGIVLKTPRRKRQPLELEKAA